MDTSAPHPQAVVPTGRVRVVNRIVLQLVRQMGRYLHGLTGCPWNHPRRLYYVPSS